MSVIVDHLSIPVMIVCRLRERLLHYLTILYAGSNVVRSRVELREMQRSIGGCRELSLRESSLTCYRWLSRDPIHSGVIVVTAHVVIPVVLVAATVAVVETTTVVVVASTAAVEWSRPHACSNRSSFWTKKIPRFCCCFSRNKIQLIKLNLPMNISGLPRLAASQLFSWFLPHSLSQLSYQL